MSSWLDEYVSNLKDSSATTTQPRASGSIVQPKAGESWLDNYVQQTQQVRPISGTETEEEDTLIERTFGKNAFTDFFGDLYRAGVSGVAAGETVGESFDVFQAAGDRELTNEDIEKYIAAVQLAQSKGVTDEMKDFQRIYEEEGESLAGFFKGVAANPSILPQLLVSSFGTLGGSFFDSGEVALSAAGGAAVGSQIPIIGTAIGGFTGLTTAMETGLTYSELLQDKLAEDGLEFNTENVRKILENDETRQDIMNRSLARGVAIGSVEALTAGFASKAAGGVSRALRTASKRASTAAAIGATAAVESTGGGLGEILGRAAAGQEMDIAEIGFEAITGNTTTPITLSRGLSKSPQYIQKSKTGDQAMTRKQVVDFLETAKDEEISAANIQIKNDPEVSELKNKKENEISIRSKIDDKITDESDRKKLFSLEEKKQEAERKNTSFSKKQLESINKSIDEINTKYLDVEEEITADDVKTKSVEPLKVKKTKPVKLPKKPIETNLTNKDLSEGETIVDSEKNEKGITVTKIAKSSEKDGVKITKFTANESNKSTNIRTPDGVSPKVAFGNKYEVDSKDIPENTEVSKVFEIREGETSVGATVELTSEDGKSTVEVDLKPRQDPQAPQIQDEPKTVQDVIANISKDISESQQEPKEIRDQKIERAKTLELEVQESELNELGAPSFTKETSKEIKKILKKAKEEEKSTEQAFNEYSGLSETQKKYVKLLLDKGLLDTEYEGYVKPLEQISVASRILRNNNLEGNGRIKVITENLENYDVTKPGLQIIYTDKSGKETKLNVDVIRDFQRRSGTRIVNSSIEGKERVYKISGDNTNQEFIKSALSKHVSAKLKDFFDYIDEKANKKHKRTIGTDAEDIPIELFQDWSNWKEQDKENRGLTQDYESDKGNFDIEGFLNVHNNNDNFYLETGDKGLFFLGTKNNQSKNIFNAPSLFDKPGVKVKLKTVFKRTQADKNGNVKPIIEVSYILSGKINKSNLSITNQKTLNKSYDDLLLEKSTSNLSESTQPKEGDLEDAFNGILEDTTTEKGERIDAKERYSDSMAKLMGKKSGKFKFFVPPSAEDFMGLIYSFLGKRELGERQKIFFETYLNAPYKRGVATLESAKQKVHEEYRLVRKNNPEARKKIGKKVPGKMFTYDQAVRVHIWSKQGTDLSNIGLSDKEISELVEIVESDINLLKYAKGISSIQTIDGQYPEPGEFWLTENVASDLNNAINKIGRKKFLEEFINNKNKIFSKDNLNKIEVIYGSNFREALQDILYRMENGTNRNFGKNRLVNTVTNWINNSVGTIMFFNMRSAVLQTISAVNYLNWNDNNLLNAAKAFANQKQFWKDFATLYNSDKLKQRRRGTKISVSEEEISNAAASSNNKVRAVLNLLLSKGFKATQIADSFAISSGGASMYRNRIKTYEKKGMSTKDAEKAAFKDFSAITEETQQSADPSLISQQQAGPLGRLILAFANTPAQYARLTKKAYLDLKNQRGDWKTNLSKIVYYAAIQNIIFSGLQTAFFAMAFDDDSDEDEVYNKELRVYNNMLDSLLKGSGLSGAALAAVKNAIFEYYKQEDKEFLADHTFTVLQLIGVSPPISSKLRKGYQAILTSKYEKDVIDAKGFAIDSPIYEVIAKPVSAATNVPLDRIVQKGENLSEALNNQNKNWERILLALGWNTWDLGIENQEHELIKKDAKDARRKEKYRRGPSNKRGKSLSEIEREKRKEMRRR